MMDERGPSPVTFLVHNVTYGVIGSWVGWLVLSMLVVAAIPAYAGRPFEPESISKAHSIEERRGGDRTPAPASRHLTVDDVLAMQEVGRVVLTPDGRTLVFEWIASYEQAPNIGAFHAGHSALSKLYRLNLEQAVAVPMPEPLFEQAARGGYWLGSLSPEGSHLAIYSLVDGTVRAGVFELASGQVRWFDFTPNYYDYVKWPVWLSEEELAYSARPPGEEPLFLPGLVARLNKLWRRAFDGQKPTATVIESTPDGLAEADNFRSGALFRVNARTGATTKLSDGHFHHLRLAPSGRYLAALKEGGFIQPNDRAVGAFRRLQLVVFELQGEPGGTVAKREPCAACDVSIGSLEWSGDGKRLSFLVRPLGAELGVAQPYEYALGSDVLAQAGPQDGQEEDRGLELLGYTELVGITGNARYVVADGEVWRVGSDGERRNLSEGIQAPVSVWHPGVDWVDWSGWSPLRTSYGVLEAGDRVLRLDPDSERFSVIDKPAPGAELVAMADRATRAVFRKVSSGGASALVVVGERGPARTVLTFNEHLADVTPARQVELTYTAEGSTLSSCALLPPDRAPGKRYPLVVYLYPHARGACTSSHIASFNPDSMELLAAQGYIVLYAANPEQVTRTPEGPDRKLASTVLTAVDEAVRAGYADPERLGLYGTSQGHHSVLLLLTETARFKAAVATHGLSNFVSLYGTRPVYARLGDALYPMGNTDRFELSRSSNALGAKPWEDPMRYVQNSALFAADKIETPLLLIHSDFDQFPLGQSEEIFTALYRLRKRASYVIYWGESHGNKSPANIRDQWRRIFAWYDEHLAPNKDAAEEATR